MRVRFSPTVYRPSRLAGVTLPLYLSRVRAGFPSPADDYVDRELDLNQHLIKNPRATFMVRAEGDSMIGEGIYSGDTLIVDRSLQPRHNSVVIACVAGELTVKKLVYLDDKLYLAAAHPDYPAIEIREGDELVIWGVVTKCIHNLEQ